MKIFLILIFFISNSSLYGGVLEPCQRIGFDQIARYAIPVFGTSIHAKKNAIKLLKKCIANFTVCIVEKDLQSKNWLSKDLIEPKDDGFDPVERELIFGMLQYVDEKSGASICIVAGNSFAQAVPWIGESWVIDGQGINKYEIYGRQLNTVMTPKSLYRALLETHIEAIARSKRDEINMNKKIEAAQKMLEEGSDPYFVSKFTEIPIEQIQMLQK